MISQPSFDAFYQALHGRPPFPWQARLARRLAAGEGWPGEIGIPTGLGKTACLDIAVWWLASQADQPEEARTAPTRIWWLVNRRLLVDSTTDHAQRMAAALAAASGDDPLAAVAARLRSLSADPEALPLEVVRLRGGAAAGRPTDPSQPAVILSTLPMYGSRLLFRGYGSSRSMRPIDAALAGTDSLVLVDEAHLAHHLMSLFEPLAACDEPEAAVLARARLRPTVVSLTATGSAEGEERFDLDGADHANDDVKQRLGAAKPLRIVELPPKTDVARPLAEATANLLGGRGAPASCVVFTNSPATARAVAAAAARLFAPDEVDLVVLTGRQREREAAAARSRILDLEHGAPAMRPDRRRERHLVVVATQTLEVGADVDFEFGITEACGVRALTQRLGRVNRLGRFAHAAATYVHAEPPPRRADAPMWPVYGSEPIEVLRRLKARASDGSVDMSPASVAALLGPPGDDPGRAPAVMPALLWEWVKTTCPPMGEAPVEPYFSGLAEPVRRVSVCWRVHIPAVGQPIWPQVREVETIDLPIEELRDVLDGESAFSRLSADRATVETAKPDQLRPGDTVVLSADVGLLDQHGWNPAAVGVVADMSLADHGLPLDPQALALLAQPVPDQELTDLLDNEDPEAAPGLVDAVVNALATATPVALSADEWNVLIASLDVQRGVVAPRGEVARLVTKTVELDARVDAFDELSAAARTAVELDAHGAGVEARARAVGMRVGLGEALARTVARSARFHDAGKADLRFQRWLDPQATSTTPLAKSTTPTSHWEAARIASGWPSGGRHEELSARLVSAWLDRQSVDIVEGLDEDLLVHLVVSHHGHGRPFLLPADGGGAHQLTSPMDGVEVTVDADLSRPDWQQPDRFARLNRRYGHWGLALLEAIVRQSDHAVSAGKWAGSDQEVL
jgi:CRISPR-associated endonuclease/helicase Cas3